MTAPVRLLEATVDAYTRDLLTSAVVLDEPDETALDRVLAGVAVGSAIGTAAASAAAHTTAAASMATASAAAQGLSTGKLSGLAIVMKWIGIGAVGGLATAGGASYWADASSDPAPARAVVLGQPQRISPARKLANQPAETHAVVTGQEAALEPSPVAQQDVREAVIARPRAPAREGSGASAPLAATNALAMDVANLDRARGALARGDTTSALEALDAYAATHRTGVLEREATILRIDALVSQGDRARAVALARRYLAQFPRDPHAQRLEQLIADR